MKLPENCQNIHDIRDAIDSIDRDIITKLGQRFKYVKAASKFKNNTQDVVAEERLKKMLQQRRVWAEEAQLNPDVIEKMYCDLVNYFIKEELQNWLQSNSSNS